MKATSVAAAHPRRALYLDLHSTDRQLRQAETDNDA